MIPLAGATSLLLLILGASKVEVTPSNDTGVWRLLPGIAVLSAPLHEFVDETAECLLNASAVTASLGIALVGAKQNLSV